LVIYVGFCSRLVEEEFGAEAVTTAFLCDAGDAVCLVVLFILFDGGNGKRDASLGLSVKR
jgi:hypothetical protein